MEKIVLLGATGSIGSSVLDVLNAYPGCFELVGISGNKNLERLGEIAHKYRPQIICLGEENPEFMARFPDTEFCFGDDGLATLAAYPSADTVIIAVSGFSGLAPTLSAIESHKRLLSANKESIVCAGDIINSMLEKNQNCIIPLDSEHNAIFNMVTRFDPEHIAHIVLTASGGPFREKPIDENVTIGDVLAHPTWDMGQYITVNSATMMNKGFEVIEAHYLFGLPYERIKVLTHPQSLVHGIMATVDGTQYMAASPSSMRYPIALSLFHPEIPAQKFPGLDLHNMNLNFSEPDMDKFPLLRTAYEAGEAGGIMPAVLNAANEVVVESFLDGKTPFYKIPRLVMDTLTRVENVKSPSLEEIINADRRARAIARGLMGL